MSDCRSIKLNKGKAAMVDAADYLPNLLEPQISLSLNQPGDRLSE